MSLETRGDHVKKLIKVLQFGLTVIVNDDDKGAQSVSVLSLHTFIYMVSVKAVERLNFNKPVEVLPVNWEIEDPSDALTGYAIPGHVA